jgi:hypothetical protein
MFRRPLSRREMEDRLIATHMAIQLRWGRITRADEWEFIRKQSDEDLDSELDEMAGQLQFENALSTAKSVFKTIVVVFVALGVAGLLLFGIRHLLAALKMI